jgi:hypothetical protein
LVHRSLDEQPVLRHTGGMIGFSSAFTADPAAGVGVYASVNVGGAGGYRPNELTNYAIALLRAAAAGGELPAVRTPAPPPVAAEEVVAQVVGRWVSADGAVFGIANRSGALFVASDGIERRLMPAGNALATDHPALAPYLIALHEASAPLLRLGDRLFGRDRAPEAPATPARVAALAGSYFAPAAWSSYAHIFAIGDQLFIGGNALREAPDDSWRFVDPSLVSERVWFEDYVDGRPQTLNASGVQFIRQLVG